MKYNHYLYILAAAVAFGTAYAADTNLVLGETYEGLTWATAPWDNGVPTSEQSVSVTLGDANNALTVVGAVSVGKIDIYGQTLLQVAGAGNSFSTTLTTTPFGDVNMRGSSRFEVKDGATFTTANGKSVDVGENSSMLVDNATFSGKFERNINSVTIQNNSVWNISGFGGTIQDANILVKDSSMLSTGDVKMSAGQLEGHSKVLTLQNSTWDANKKGINASGIVKLLDSSISNLDHFNIAAEGGQAKGENQLYLQGSSSESLSSLSAANLWWNTNKASTSTLIQDGNTAVNLTTIRSDNNTDGGGNVLWLLQNSNNTIKLTGDASWGDNGKTKNETGSWVLTTAKTENGVETLASNSSLTFNSINLKASAVVGNNLNTVVDWAGATNNIQANYDIVVDNSAAASSSATSSFILRDGATATVNRYVAVGSQNGLSGTASLEVKNGATLTQKNSVSVVNSTLAGSTAVSSITIDNATLARTSGNLFIGVGSYAKDVNPRQDAISGTSIFTFKNAGEVTYGGGILLAGSSVDLSASGNNYTNVAKLVVDNTKLTMNGELWMGHSQSNGSTIYGGTTILEVSGENAAFISANKGLYSAYNTTIYGGDRHINVTGKNNEVFFKETFFMTSANGAVQNGGSFEVNIQGEGHTFTSRQFDIGKVNATAGSNTIILNGTNSANLNKLLTEYADFFVKSSSVAGSTVENSVIFAGNSMLQRTNGSTVIVNVGYNDNPTAGTANFIVKGSGNQIFGENLNLGNSTGGKAVFRVEGYANDVNFANTVYVRGAGDTYENAVGGRMEFVLDYSGRNGDIAMISTNNVGDFSGTLLIDFSALTGDFDNEKFLVISSTNSWEGIYNSWAAKNLVSFNMREDTDSAALSYEGGNLYVTYTSYVPEPATYAAIFGAIALAFAAYRRRKN